MTYPDFNITDLLTGFWFGFGSALLAGGAGWFYHVVAKSFKMIAK